MDTASDCATPCRARAACLQRRGCVAAQDGALFLAARCSVLVLFYSLQETAFGVDMDKQLAQLQHNIARVRRVIRIQGPKMQAINRLVRIAHPLHTFRKQTARATLPCSRPTKGQW
jgi:hypothetical protein